MENLDIQDQVVPDSTQFIPSIDKPIEKSSKVNIGKAIRLYFERNVPQCDIARLMGVTDQAIDQVLRPYKQILFSKGEIDVLRKRKDDLIEGSFYRLLLDTSDPIKRDKATLNQTSYALKQIHEIGRLEQGLSTDNTAVQLGIDPALRGSLNSISRRLSGRLNPGNRDKAISKQVVSLPDSDNE